MKGKTMRTNQKLKHYNKIIKTLNNQVATQVVISLGDRPVTIGEIEEGVVDALGLLEDSTSTVCAFRGHDNEAEYLREMLQNLYYLLAEEDIINLVRKQVQVKNDDDDEN